MLCLCCVVFGGLDSPHDDADKVQHVPAVADVGVLVHDQTIGNDLKERLYREDDEEGILHCLLHTHRGTGDTVAILIRCGFKYIYVNMNI